MGKPIIWNGVNAKLINTGELIDVNNLIYPRTGEKNYFGAAQSCVPLTAPTWATSGTITVATDVLAADLPRAITTQSGIKFTGGSSAAAYAFYRFTLDAADANLVMQLQFAQNALAGYVSGDFQIQVWSNTNSTYTGTSTRLVLSTDSGGNTGLPNLEGTFRTTFTTPATVGASAAPFMEIRVGFTSTAHAIVLSDILCGPGNQIQGAAVSPWQTLSGVTQNGSSNGQPFTNTTLTDSVFRRVGDSVDIELLFSFTGTPGTGTGGFTVVLPSSLGLLDTTKWTDNKNRGEMAFLADGAGKTYAFGMAIFNNAGSISVQFQQVAGNTSVGAGGSGGSFQPPTIPFTIANGATFGVSLRSLPLANLAGSGTVNVVQNDVEYAWNTDTSTSNNTSSANAGYGPAGVAVGAFTASTTTKRAFFQSPVQPTDKLFLKFQSQSGVGPWFEVGEGMFRNGLQNLTIQSPITYGACFDFGSGGVGTNFVDIVFGQYVYNNSGSYAAAGVAWSTLSTYRWRVRKAAGGQAVGFSIVNPGVSAGLVSASGLPGNTTGTAIATGFVGELLSNTGTQSAPVTNTFYGLCTVTLTPGVWITMNNLSLSYSGAPSVTDLRVGSSTVNTAINDTFPSMWSSSTGIVQNGSNSIVLNSGPRYFTVGVNTTVFCTAFMGFTGGTSISLNGRIQAIRIA